jgi:hypothetical protein
MIGALQNIHVILSSNKNKLLLKNKHKNMTELIMTSRASLLTK